MNAEQIMIGVERQQERTDKVFTGVEFNVRGNTIVMNYVYDQDQNTEQGSGDDLIIPHDSDPVFMNEDEMNELLDKLKDKNIYYTIRKDEFI